MIKYNHEELAEAIVIRALKDYKIACKKSDEKTKKECLKFFMSEELSLYTNIDGIDIIRRLDYIDNIGRRYSIKKKLTYAEVREVKKLIATGKPDKEIAERYGVRKKSIWKIRTGRSFVKVK